VVYAAKKASSPAGCALATLSIGARAQHRAQNQSQHAHKVVTHLLSEGLLEVMPGTGTVVAPLPESTAAERARLLEDQLEQLAVEAKKLGVDLEDVTTALARHWKRLETGKGDRTKK